MNTLKQAIRTQNEIMVKLVLMDNLDISNNMILLALYTCDINLLKVISDQLNENKKYYCRFYLQFQELSLIVSNDDTCLIENFKYFIDSETICCVLNISLEKSEGLNCLKKILKLKIVTRPHHIYALLKTAFKNGNSEALNIISPYSSKRMLKYAISENDSKMLNIILTSLTKKLPTNVINTCIDGLNLSHLKGDLLSKGLKNNCILTLDKFVIKKKPIRI